MVAGGRMSLDDHNRLLQPPRIVLNSTSAIHERRRQQSLKTESDGNRPNSSSQLHDSEASVTNKSHDACSEKSQETVTWKERIRHFHWTWFTLTMSTGGIANVIYNVPEDMRFTGLYEIGVVFFLFNLCLFGFNCIMISTRFYLWPNAFRESFSHPNESLFVPAFVISLATDLINITQYGLQYHKAGKWLIETMVVFYWIYIALAISFSAGIFLTIWSTQTFTLAQMTPVWIFPAYPLLMAGPFAAVLSDPRIAATGHNALNIIIGGLVTQGIGFLVSIMIYSAYIYRLMSQKLPLEPVRPTMFISVGPTGFTVFGLINMGLNFPQVVHETFMGNGLLTGHITRVLATWAGLWIWGLGLWFFVVSVGAHWSCVSHGRLHFALNWNGFIFPNTAFVTGTFAVARALDDNKPLEIVACVMACLVIFAWLFVFAMCFRAVWLHQILWPSKQDEKDAEILRTRFQNHRIAMDNPYGTLRRGGSHIAQSPGPSSLRHHALLPQTPYVMDLEAARHHSIA